MRKTLNDVKKILNSNDNMRKLLSFTPLQYMIDSIEENPKLAELYVNEGENTCLVLFGNYLFTAGKQIDEALNYLYNEILTCEVKNRLEILIVFFENEDWKNSITSLFTDKCRAYERSLYRIKPTFSHDDYDNNHSSIVRITKQLLNSEIKNIDMIINEVTTYDDMDDFTDRGIGFSPVIDNKVCGFCTSEYPSKNEIAIGIEVLKEHQNKGIAKKMTKMLLNEASKKNLTVYWECWKNNLASANTAISCGFEKIADYPVIFIEL